VALEPLIAGACPRGRRARASPAARAPRRGGGSCGEASSIQRGRTLDPNKACLRANMFAPKHVCACWRRTSRTWPLSVKESFSRGGAGQVRQRVRRGGDVEELKERDHLSGKSGRPHSESGRPRPESGRPPFRRKRIPRASAPCEAAQVAGRRAGRLPRLMHGHGTRCGAHGCTVPPRPSPRTNRTRLVLLPVLAGHVSGV
jgi:hypothetical protein